MPVSENLRVLVIDDNQAIHRDFQKILGMRDRSDATGEAESQLFGQTRRATKAPRFELSFAFQGEEGLALVERAADAGRPFAVAFVDVRMPPGWDGVETIERIWQKYPDLETVICTAHSDYSWDEMTTKLGYSDRLVILKKPFDNIEVLQLATALTEKWRLRQQAGFRLADLETLVEERTVELRTAHRTVEEANRRLTAEVGERRQAEAAARLWQQRYDLISSAARQVVYDYDRRTGTVVWSGSVESVLGLSVDKLGPGLGGWTKLIHENDRPEANRLLAEAEMAEGACDRVYRLKCGSGEYRWIHDRSYVLGTTLEQPRRRLGVVEDISERRWAEQRIREQAELLNRTQDAILVCDLDYCVLYWNRAAERLYGWTAAEALRQKVPDFLHRQSPDAFRFASAETIATGAWVGELEPTARDGRSIVVESRWNLLHDDTGAPTSLLVVNTDVTERRQLEARFLRAQRLESIGFLASGIAHDLNNVFTPILMSGQMLSEKTKDPALAPLLEVLQASAKRGASMVRQVLTFAQGADGVRGNLNMQRLLRELESLVRDTFPRSIELCTHFDESIHNVHGNATQFHQVLMNLCVNARDAMPDGGALTVAAQNMAIDETFARMQPDAVPGPYILLTVSDTGAGMPPEVLDRVFEPFYTTKSADKGTGLGLSTTLGIVKSHGGFIDVESAPGKGTRIQVFLPANREPTDGPDVADPPFEAAGHGEHILVVDDEAPVRQVTQAALESYGYTVEVAADGSEAVAKFATNPKRFRLVITDMMMPFMDGPTTIRAIQRLDPAVPIIAVSGVTGSPSYQLAAQSEHVTFLLKPYTANQLHDVVRAVLEKFAATS